MKNIFRALLIGLSLLTVPMMANAQVHEEGGVATTKSVSAQDENGNYTIKLETWALGETSVETTGKPVDVVLVLDVSGSMDFPKGSVTAETKAFTYNDIANSEYTYFYYWQNNYWKVYPRRNGNNYDLYVYPGNPTRVGYQRNAADTPITQYHQGSWWQDPYYEEITLYRGTETRMDALKNAVGAFIDSIELDDHQDKNGEEREHRLGNRISIVKFAGDSSNEVGNDTYDANTGGETNYSQIVVNLTNVEGNVTTLKNAVNGFQSMGGTQAGYGMDHAVRALADAAADHNKVVVFFTDGNPDDNFGAIGNASNGGTRAYRIKNSLGAVVYTIGMFTSSPGTNSDTYRYLNYVSSNYPTATVNNGNMNQGTGGSNQGFYQDASGEVDLTAIFQQISQGIGGSERPVGTSTQIRDVVSSSFTIPEGFNASDVVIYSIRAKKETSLVWDPSTKVNYNPSSTDSDGVSATIDVQDGHKRLVVTGFDFSKADTPEGSNSGNGNWVGQRYTEAEGYFYAGAKLVIEFSIKSVDGATGGAGTNTNTGDSGVWVLKDDGETYENINHYVIPHTTLPINIVIKKTGLRHGESATFEIERVRPKNWDEDKTLAENIAAMEYNDIGKPVPGDEWEDWTKVIVTNKGDDKAEVTKTLVALDPYYVYRVAEDKWGWAYTVSGNTMSDGSIPNTATVELNPFSFVNTLKKDAVKHAEAVTINHFGYTIQTGEFQGEQEEHYKSSKGNYFKP
jgi:hypothetical protein